MINLIDNFFDQIETAKIYNGSNDNGGSDYTEIYFFMGRDSALCISKSDNRVLYCFKFDQFQINILAVDKFSILLGGKPLFFYLNEQSAEDEVIRVENIGSIQKGNKSVTVQDDEFIMGKRKLNHGIKYKYKDFCENCEQKICSRYDVINAKDFRLGSGKVSDDKMGQYDNYCRGKIKKFSCLEDGSLN